MEFTYYNPVKLFHGATKIGEVASKELWRQGTTYHRW